jgi:Sensors of blue-light using FAD
MIRLIYASVARPGLAYAELREILTQAESSNRREGITGVLCFSTGYFLQALEGGRSAVNALYGRIARDPRHATCNIFACEDIETRLFGEWTMKLIGLDATSTSSRRLLFLRHANTTQFDPRLLTGSQACGFLRELADLECLAAA